MRTTKLPPPTRFAGKATGKRGQDPGMQKQARRFSGRSTSGRLLPTGRKNGLSRTAMLFKIATVAGHKLTVPEMNKFKNVNPRSLERVYDEVLRIGDAGNAMFALRLLLG